MTLKTLLEFVYAEAKINLQDADNAHKDIMIGVKPHEIPEKYLNCKIENQGVWGLVISIHTK